MILKAHKDKAVKNFLDSGNLMYYCPGIELISSYQTPGFFQFWPFRTNFIQPKIHFNISLSNYQVFLIRG